MKKEMENFSQTKTGIPWDSSYQKLLLEKILTKKMSEISSYPTFQYPNKDYQNIKRTLQDKVLLFGYGSLMYKATKDAKGNQSIKEENLSTMYPGIAFGVKRVFNYEEKKGWKKEIRIANEKAMLNLVKSDTGSPVNGVLIEIDMEDLTNLVDRELGYDLVPIPVAPWDDAVIQNPSIRIDIAYTFMASKDLRDGVAYTSDKFYPIRPYVDVVEKAAASHGELFAEMWRNNSYLADEKTPIKNWNRTFDTHF